MHAVTRHPLPVHASTEWGGEKNMIIPQVTNELGKALVEERLHEAERARLARTARMRTRGNRIWVSWWLSRLARWTRAMRSGVAFVREEDVPHRAVFRLPPAP